MSDLRKLVNGFMSSFEGIVEFINNIFRDHKI